MQRLAFFELTMGTVEPNSIRHSERILEESDYNKTELH